jgi:hypothetical protein
LARRVLYLKMAGRSWRLDNESHDFERGHTDNSRLGPGTGLFLSDLHSITIRKSHDGVAGEWKLDGLEIFTNGSPLYHHLSINTWLHNDSLIWITAI